MFDSVQLSCPTCSDGVVNADTRLLLVASNDDFPDDDLDYDWTIFFLRELVSY